MAGSISTYDLKSADDFLLRISLSAYSMSPMEKGKSSLPPR